MTYFPKYAPPNNQKVFLIVNMLPILRDSSIDWDLETEILNDPLFTFAVEPYQWCSATTPNADSLPLATTVLYILDSQGCLKHRMQVRMTLNMWFLLPLARVWLKMFFLLNYLANLRLKESQSPCCSGHHQRAAAMALPYPVAVGFNKGTRWKASASQAQWAPHQAH